MSTRPTKAAEWVLACDGSNPKYPFGFTCLRCGGTEYLPREELPVDEYLARATRFRGVHAECTEPKRPATKARR